MFLKNTVFLVQMFETHNKRHTETVYYSAVEYKIQPEDVSWRSIKVMLYFFPFFFLKGYLFFLKETRIGRKKMGKHM